VTLNPIYQILFPSGAPCVKLNQNRRMLLYLSSSRKIALALQLSAMYRSCINSQGEWSLR